MSQKVYQMLINQAKEVIECEFGLIDDKGIIVAGSNERLVGVYDINYPEVLSAKQQVYVLDNVTYINLYNKNKPELIGYVKNTSEEYANYLYLFLANALEMKNYYDEKYDKDKFIKSVLLNNILPADTIIKARDLGIDTDVSRVALLIKTEWEKEVIVYDTMAELFPDRENDSLIVIDEGSIALIKELKDSDTEIDVENIADVIYDNVSSETMVKIQIGIGNKARTIKELTRSFKQAQEAIVIGKIFESDKNIYHYNKLGIGRLVYQLPVTACELFISEVFKDNSLDMLDEETMTTITKFFENNLNVSEASRQLYIHRNTLVYRLDKILKITGLDLTKFDHAVVFNMAILLKKYLASQEEGRV